MSLRTKFFNVQRPHVIFVHIPKTAGTSVSNLLCDIGATKPKPFLSSALIGRREFGKHSCALEYKNVLGKKFCQAFTFSVVRNSWDWIWSFYRFILFTTISPDTGNPWRHNLYPVVKDMNFSAFVDFITLSSGLDELPTAKRMRSYGIKEVNQFNFLHDNSGQLLVENIFHYENLHSELPNKLRDIGYPLRELPKINSSVKISTYRDAYTPKARDAVASKFEKDIEHFGFSF